MGMFDAFNISATGLTGQRLRMDVISSNVANATTTRTPEGGPYKRQRAIFAPVNIRPFYKSALVPSRIEHGVGQGVRVVKYRAGRRAVQADLRPDPSRRHQNRSQEGLCGVANVNIVMEMTDLISASRSYEANVTMVNNAVRCT